MDYRWLYALIMKLAICLESIIPLSSKKAQRSVNFEVKLKDKTLRFPQKGIEMQDSTVFIWPLECGT